MLWAFGAEFFTDIGYNRTKYRPWASTTLSHNTVVVDRAPQNGTQTKGRLLAYADDSHGWSFVQAEDFEAYGSPVTRYRRSLLLNSVDLEAPYLVDVFEVRGGRMHDYALHGPTVFDSTATTDVPLEPMNGERPLLTPEEAAQFDAAKHPYGHFTNVRTATVADEFTVTFQLNDPFRLPAYTPNSRYPAGSSFHYAVDPAKYADRGELGVRTHFVGLAGKQSGMSRVVLGETPSLLRGGLLGGPLTDKLRRPSLLVRRAETSELSSVFIAVHEPYYGAPKVLSVRRLKTAQADTAAVALEIARADRTDTILLALDGAGVAVSGPRSAANPPASLRGKLAVVERGSGKPAVGWMFAGTSLVQGEFRLQAPSAAYVGTVDAATSVWDGGDENTFTTSALLPEGTDLRGQWMIVHHGDGQADEGYRIDRVERRGKQTVIRLTDDPGLRISGATTEEIFFPRRRWTGANRFTLATERSSPSARNAVGSSE